MRRYNHLLAFGAAAALVVLILDSRCAAMAAAEGMELCLKTVIPSLFPFLFLTSLLIITLHGGSPLLQWLGGFLGFGHGCEGLVLAAFLGGYPAGARAVGEAWESGLLTRKDAQRLLMFCSNAGPAFLFGMTGIQFSGMADVWALWGIHILSAVSVALLYPASPIGKASSGGRKVSVAGCLNSSVRTMGIICGWIVIFRIVLGWMERWFLWYLPDVLQTAAAGFLELSIGCCRLGAVEDPGTRFLLCAMMLSFGGVCVAMQTASVIGDLSVRPYLKGKLLQTLFSAAYSLLWLREKWLLPAAAAAGIVLLRGIQKKRSGIPAYSVV